MTKPKPIRRYFGECDAYRCKQPARYKLVSPTTGHETPYCSRHRNAATVRPEHCYWVDAWETGG